VLAGAIEAFEGLALDDAAIRANAERFRPERFDAAITDELQAALAQAQQAPRPDSTAGSVARMMARSRPSDQPDTYW